MTIQSPLSLFIDDQLGILAVFLIGANENKIHIGCNAEAAAAAERAFQLIAQVRRAVVQEFDRLSIGKPIFQIDIPAHKRIELFKLRHAVDL